MYVMANSTHKDYSSYWIFLFVCLSHFLVLLWLIFFSTSFAPIRPSERLVVKTITLNDSVKEQKSSQVSVSQIQNPPQSKSIEASQTLKTQKEVSVEPKVESKKETKVEPKPAEPKKELKTKETIAKEIKTKEAKTEVKKTAKVEDKKPVKVPTKDAKKTPVEKKQPKQEEKKSSQKIEPAKKNIEKSPPKSTAKSESSSSNAQAEALKTKQKELFAKAQESISKIGKNSNKTVTQPTPSASLSELPGKIESLSVEDLNPGDQTLSSPKEVGYREELASRLKLLLTLPEYGEVKVKLTLLRSGKVSNVVVVNSMSTKNRNYIEKTIPTLSFSGFGSNFSNMANYTFLISLSNE